MLPWLNRIYPTLGRYSKLRKSKSQRCFCNSSNGDAGDDKVEGKLYEPSVEELLDNAAMGIGPNDEIDENDDWQTSPYPKGAIFNANQSQALKSLRPKIDPRDTSIILFPGQGSQYVGMGKDLLKYPGAVDIFDAANEILKYDLLKLMLHGPKEQLNLTKYCQPAVVVCSLAALEKLKEERPTAIENCVATAGFSVGEITALAFAGVFKFGDAIKLVRTRAEAMQLASELEPGGMATVVLGPTSKLSDAMEKAKEWCSERGISNPECRVATYLSPHIKVISGHIEALRYISCNKRFYKLEDVIKMPVNGAFHSILMLPAASEFRRKLKKIEIMDPLISVHSNVNGEYYRDKDHVLIQLTKQIYKPIKWEQMLHILYERDPQTNFPETIVCGPTNSLKSYLHNVNQKAARAVQFMYSYHSDFGIRRVLPLSVSGAFHSSLMLPAVETFKKVLENVELHEPNAYIYSNVNAKRYILSLLKKQLPKQICKAVLWEQTIQKLFMRDNKSEFPSSYICGPGSKSLRRILAEINNKAAQNCVSI